MRAIQVFALCGHHSKMVYSIKELYQVETSVFRSASATHVFMYLNLHETIRR